MLGALNSARQSRKENYARLKKTFPGCSFVGVRKSSSELLGIS